MKQWTHNPDIAVAFNSADRQNSHVVPQLDIAGLPCARKSNVERVRKFFEMQNRSCAMVVGMHRSGTSCTAGILAKLGYEAPENMIGANKSNPKGHWEAVPVARLNDRILKFAGNEWQSWEALNLNWINTPYFDRFVEEGRSVLCEIFTDAPMIVLKDPRLCRLASVWLEVLKSSGFETTVFMPLRHPAEVSASLGLRNSMDAAQGQYLWLRYLLDAESGTRGRRRFFFHYSKLVANWRKTLRQAEVAVGAVFPRLNDATAVSIDAFVDQTLYRNRSTDRGGVELLDPLVEELFQILAGWADGGERAEDFRRIDEINRTFSAFAKQARPLFLAFDDVQARLKDMQASLAQQKAGLEEAEVQPEAGATAKSAATPDVANFISARQNEIDSLQSMLKQITKELVDDGTGLRASLAKLLSNAQSEKLATVAGAEIEKQEANEKIGALISELAEMHEASETAAKQATELREMIESLRLHDAQASVDAAQAHQTISELESCVSALTSELEQKRAEIDHVYAERDDIAKQIEALARDAEEARARELGLERQLQKSNDELIASLDEIVTLANLLRNAEQNALSVQADLNAEQKARRALEKEIMAQQVKAAARQEQVAELREKLADAAAGRRTVQEKKNAADAKLLMLRETHATLQAKVEALKREVKNQTALAEAVEIEKSLASSKLKALRVKQESLLAKKSRLELENRRANARAKSADYHAKLTSRILALMAKEELALPSTKKPSKLLGRIFGSRQRSWKKFCDSLADQGVFDANAYLIMYPDVVEAEMDPLVHYLTRGQLERRKLPHNVEQIVMGGKDREQLELNK